MSLLDLIILLVLAFGVIRGYATGVIQQVVGIAGVMLAFALALQLMEAAGALVARSLAVSETIAPLVGFVLVFLAVRVVVFGIARAAETVTEALQLSLVNRLAGGVAGALQAALLLSLLFLLLDPLGVPGAQERQEARFYAPVAAALPEAWDYAAAQWPRLENASEKFSHHVEAQLGRL